MSPQVWPSAANDTGWIPVALSAPWTAFGSGTAYRRKNGIVTVAIDAQHSSTYSSGSTLTWLPAGFWPSRRILGSHTYLGATGLILVHTSGQVIVGEGLSAPTSYAFGSISFPL